MYVKFVLSTLHTCIGRDRKRCVTWPNIYINCYATHIYNYAITSLMHGFIPKTHITSDDGCHQALVASQLITPTNTINFPLFFHVKLSIHVHLFLWHVCWYWLVPSLVQVCNAMTFLDWIPKIVMFLFAAHFVVKHIKTLHPFDLFKSFFHCYCCLC